MFQVSTKKTHVLGSHNVSVLSLVGQVVSAQNKSHPVELVAGLGAKARREDKEIEK